MTRPDRRLVGALGDRDYLVSGRGGADAGLAAPTQVERRRRDTYREDVAMRIAMDYSLDRGTLKSMHEENEFEIPPPVIINRWRRENPDFDDVMTECEKARGLVMIEDTVGIADDDLVTPDRAKVRIAARQRLAAGYDPVRFGTGPRGEAGSETRAKSVRQMTRAELELIAKSAGLISGPAGAAGGTGPALIEGSDGTVTE